MNLEIFKKQKKFRKGGFHSDPNLGWEAVLYFTFALVVAALAFGGYLFARTGRSLEGAGEMSPSQINIVKKERIDKALLYFSEKEKKSAEILNSPSPVIDPS